eukprot:1039051-Pelagomonas_calceolata.AAC.1
MALCANVAPNPWLTQDKRSYLQGYHISAHCAAHHKPNVAAWHMISHMLTCARSHTLHADLLRQLLCTEQNLGTPHVQGQHAWRLSGLGASNWCKWRQVACDAH